MSCVPIRPITHKLSCLMISWWKLSRLMISFMKDMKWCLPLQSSITITTRPGRPATHPDSLHCEAKHFSKMAACNMIFNYLTFCDIGSNLFWKSKGLYGPIRSALWQATAELFIKVTLRQGSPGNKLITADLPFGGEVLLCVSRTFLPFTCVDSLLFTVGKAKRK